MPTNRKADYKTNLLILKRLSPRAMIVETIYEEALMALFEVGRIFTKPHCAPHVPFQRALVQVMVVFSKNLWRLASRTFKISPDIVVEALP